MFEKLIDVVLQFIDKVLPFAVVNQTDEGVRLRFGVFKSILKAGFHWKIPFADSIVTNSIVWTTMSLPAQSVTTKDGKSVVVKGIVKYRVSDIQVFVLDVWDAVDAISDMTQGVIFEIVKNKTWSECQSPDLKNVITKKGTGDTEAVIERCVSKISRRNKSLMKEVPVPQERIASTFDKGLGAGLGGGAVGVVVGGIIVFFINK